MAMTYARLFRASMIRTAVLGGFVAMGLAGAAVHIASAASFTLVDGNSVLRGGTTAQASGFDWVVDGVDHLTELSNWYRIGGGPELSVHTLTVGPGVLSDTNLSGHNDTITVPYTDPLGRFELEIDLAVVGGALGSGFSGLDEDIRITNIQPVQKLNISFYEYLDLDLYESPNDDTVELYTQNNWGQYDALTDTDWSFDVDRYELEHFPNTLNKLTDGSASNLSDVWPAATGPLGPGNVTLAAQWNFVGPIGPRFAIEPGETVTIHKEGHLQMYFVPEPASWLMASLTTLALLLGRGKRMRVETKS